MRATLSVEGYQEHLRHCALENCDGVLLCSAILLALPCWFAVLVCYSPVVCGAPAVCIDPEYSAVHLSYSPCSCVFCLRHLHSNGIFVTSGVSKVCVSCETCGGCLSSAVGCARGRVKPHGRFNAHGRFKAYGRFNPRRSQNTARTCTCSRLALPCYSTSPAERLAAMNTSMGTNMSTHTQRITRI